MIGTCILLSAAMVYGTTTLAPQSRTEIACVQALHDAAFPCRASDSPVRTRQSQKPRWGVRPPRRTHCHNRRRVSPNRTVLEGVWSDRRRRHQVVFRLAPEHT